MPAEPYIEPGYWEYDYTDPRPVPAALPVGDVRIVWRDLGGDVQLQGFDLARGDALKSAVIVSLFTDRRAEPDDVLPGSVEDRRGWWGDAFPDVAGDRIGSRLWLLSREKQLGSVIERARQYAEEALAWLVEDGIASRVAVTAEAPRTGLLALGITIERPKLPDVEYRFSTAWEGLEAA